MGSYSNDIQTSVNPSTKNPREIWIDYCRWCDGYFDVRRDGRLRVHGPRASRCPGSGELGGNGR